MCRATATSTTVVSNVVSKHIDVMVTAETNHTAETKQEINLDKVFDYLFALGELMKDADALELSNATTIQAWEQMLSSTESGEIEYEAAMDKMEELIDKDPAVLKLAEATNCFELIHEDGGKEGVTELTNFRRLLDHVKWLPQYHDALVACVNWKNGATTAEQLEQWFEKQIVEGKLDKRWVVQAMQMTKEAPAPPAQVQVEALIKAAEQGDVDAMFQVAHMCESPQQALAWFTRAAQNGHPEAAIACSQIEVDADKIDAFIRLAAANGHEGAQHMVDQAASEDLKERQVHEQKTLEELYAENPNQAVWGYNPDAEGQYQKKCAVLAASLFGVLSVAVSFM